MLIALWDGQGNVTVGEAGVGGCRLCPQFNATPSVISIDQWAICPLGGPLCRRASPLVWSWMKTSAPGWPLHWPKYPSPLGRPAYNMEQFRVALLARRKPVVFLARSYKHHWVSLCHCEFRVEDLVTTQWAIFKWSISALMNRLLLLLLSLHSSLFSCTVFDENIQNTQKKSQPE